MAKRHWVRVAVNPQGVKNVLRAESQQLSDDGGPNRRTDSV
jgi:hypothetical protein